MASAPSRGLVGLFKRGWNEIPEVVLSHIGSTAGVVIGAYALYKYYQLDLDNRKHKFEYTVIRHDDPRAAKVHKNYD